MLINAVLSATFLLPLSSYYITLQVMLRRMQLTVDSDLNGESPQFTLTCISTGGPATTVTEALHVTCLL